LGELGLLPGNADHFTCDSKIHVSYAIQFAPLSAKIKIKVSYAIHFLRTKTESFLAVPINPLRG